MVLSGYPSPLYEEMFGDWSRHELKTWTNQGNSKAPRTEVAWCNRVDLGRDGELELVGSMALRPGGSDA